VKGLQAKLNFNPGAMRPGAAPPSKVGVGSAATQKCYIFFAFKYIYTFLFFFYLGT
jgi:hypothetical protein